MSNCDESLIDDVITRIKAIDGAHTRADVIKAIQDATNKALGVNEEEQTDSEQTDSEQTDNEQTSEEFHKVDNDETPFKIDWQSEYINLANSMTDILDNYKKELDNPETDYKELATIAYDKMNNIIKAMLTKIAE